MGTLVWWWQGLDWLKTSSVTWAGVTGTTGRRAGISLSPCGLPHACWSQARWTAHELASPRANPNRLRPPGSPVPGILQAGTLEWVAISFSDA